MLKQESSKEQRSSSVFNHFVVERASKRGSKYVLLAKIIGVVLVIYLFVSQISQLNEAKKKNTNLRAQDSAYSGKISELYASLQKEKEAQEEINLDIEGYEHRKSSSKDESDIEKAKEKNRMKIEELQQDKEKLERRIEGQKFELETINKEIRKQK